MGGHTASNAPRLLFIGLDSMPAGLVFGRLREHMPCTWELACRGAHGPLRSCVPPITVPAWASMLSGRDAGELGLYGFRNRVRGTYDLRLPRADDVREKRVWDLLAEAGRRVAVLFVPPMDTPLPVRGVSAACFMSRGGGSWTYPAELASELEERFGAYVPDVVDRTGEPRAVLQRIYEATRQRFQMARYIWEVHAPDALFVVDLGPDRVHHAFLHHIDPTHPRYDSIDAFNVEVAGYYCALDEQVGALALLAGPDATTVVASDHGVRPMLGVVRVNEWLLREGWLALKGARPATAAALSPADIDWSRTRAWAEGGYFARVFLNVRGREPEGIIDPAVVEPTRDALIGLVERLRAELGLAIPIEIVMPDQWYRAARGEPPDLMLFFGDLSHRSDGTVGGAPGLVADRMPDRIDSANHDWNGMLVMAGPGVTSRGLLQGASIFDVGPTLLAHAGIEPPRDWLGRALR